MPKPVERFLFIVVMRVEYPEDGPEYVIHVISDHASHFEASEAWESYVPEPGYTGMVIGVYV